MPQNRPNHNVADAVLLLAAGSLRVVGATIRVSVSQDRKTILFSTTVTSGSDLMLIENFR